MNMRERLTRLSTLVVSGAHSGMVGDYPLAVCDGSSVTLPGLVAVDHLRRRCVGESQYPPYSPEYRWHYFSQQTKDEVLILKMFDNDPDVKARCCVV